MGVRQYTEWSVVNGERREDDIVQCQSSVDILQVCSCVGECDTRVHKVGRLDSGTGDDFGCVHPWVDGLHTKHMTRSRFLVRL